MTPPSETPPAPEPENYTVKKRGTLSDIALSLQNESDKCARPFSQVLEFIASKLTREPKKHIASHAKILTAEPLPGRDELIRQLKEFISPDVCLNMADQDKLYADTREYLKDPNKEALLAIIRNINSNRTRCSDCLSAVCEKRDPAFPLQEVNTGRVFEN